MKAGLASLAIFLLAVSSAGAQISPFDMSRERPAVSTPPRPAGPVPAQTNLSPAATAIAPQAGLPARRYIVPFTELVLSGEYTQRSWSVFLTPEQAAAKTQLHLGYQTTIVIAPEASRLKLSINGSKLIDAPIAASENDSDFSVGIPAGVLHAGLNDVAISAVQRHRTDCTIQSTYELVTQIDIARTYLIFDGPEAARWKRVEDLRAIGVDENGTTSFNLIVPSLGQTISTSAAVRLGEALALMANMPNQSFNVSEAGSSATKSGVANVVLGPVSELAKVLAAVPAGAEEAPIATVVDDPGLGPSTIVISGPNWEAVDMAIDDIAKQVDRPAGSLRTSLASRTWRTPDVPFLADASRLKFSELGVDTLEFSGRRLRIDFAVGVPADFYADAYGEATILLDAAYSQDVLPGSHIDVYVNDNIAATVPITRAGGEILRHLPIKVTMRHFRPGDNTIALEAVLLTRADAICLPGATAQDNQRFVVFDSSEFVMPEFARAARTPDLAALSGTGFPYNRAEYALPLIMDRAQAETVSAGVTFLARISVAAGRLIGVDTSTSATAVADRNALFIGAISQVPPAVLDQVGISSDNSSTWGEPVLANRPNTEATFDQWRQKLRGSGWRGQVSSFQDWMNRTFNISIDSFRILPGRQTQFTPGGSTNLVVAQDAGPSSGGTWTVVTAPADKDLQDGVRVLTEQSTWRQMGGHLTTIDVANKKIATIPVTRFTFVETQPPSLSNYRLIITNWFSANALSYSVVLTLFSILLGLATAGLLGSLGRRR